MTDIKPMTDEEIEKLRKVCRLGIGISGHKGERLIATIDALKAERDQARREAASVAIDACQILDVVKLEWADAWTEWDQNVRDRLSALAAKEKK